MLRALCSVLRVPCSVLRAPCSVLRAPCSVFRTPCVESRANRAIRAGEAPEGRVHPAFATQPLRNGAASPSGAASGHRASMPIGDDTTVCVKTCPSCSESRADRPARARRASDGRVRPAFATRSRPNGRGCRRRRVTAWRRQRRLGTDVDADRRTPRRESAPALLVSKAGPIGPCGLLGHQQGGFALLSQRDGCGTGGDCGETAGRPAG